MVRNRKANAAAMPPVVGHRLPQGLKINVSRLMHRTEVLGYLNNCSHPPTYEPLNELFQRHFIVQGGMQSVRATNEIQPLPVMCMHPPLQTLRFITLYHSISDYL